MQDGDIVKGSNGKFYQWTDGIPVEIPTPVEAAPKAPKAPKVAHVATADGFKPTVGTFTLKQGADEGKVVACVRFRHAGSKLSVGAAKDLAEMPDAELKPLLRAYIAKAAALGQ